MAQLQGVLTAACGSCYIDIRIAYAINDDILRLACAGDCLGLNLFLEVIAVGNVTVFRLGGLRLIRGIYCLDVVQQDPGGMLALLTISHVVAQIQMVAVFGQGNDIACLPLIYQRPNYLIGVGAFRIFLAFCGQL